MLVCDVMMPRLSGLSVCRELRERADTRTLPIVLLTARCFDEDIQQVMSLGAIEYIGKPFDFSRLIATVGVLCGRTAPASGMRTIELTVEGTLR